MEASRAALQHSEGGVVPRAHEEAARAIQQLHIDLRLIHEENLFAALGRMLKAATLQKVDAVGDGHDALLNGRVAQFDTAILLLSRRARDVAEQLEPRCGLDRDERRAAALLSLGLQAQLL